MDPISLTTSVIAIATLAAQSTKAAYRIVDRLTETPQAIAHSKSLLFDTQNTLDTLNHTIITNSKTPTRLESILRVIKVEDTLRWTQNLCDDFNTTITKYTSRSTSSRLSNRDKLLMNLHISKICSLNKQLGDCQRTISLVLETIILIVSVDTSENIKQLSIRFQDQEQALTVLTTQLSNNPTPAQEVSDCLASNSDEARSTMLDQQTSVELRTTLRELCRAAISVTKARRTGQNFSDMQTDRSVAMQGIVGEAQYGVEQSFGKLTAQNNSRAFQGQMDAGSFSHMFK